MLVIASTCKVRGNLIEKPRLLQFPRNDNSQIGIWGGL